MYNENFMLGMVKFNKRNGFMVVEFPQLSTNFISELNPSIVQNIMDSNNFIDRYSIADMAVKICMNQMISHDKKYSGDTKNINTDILVNNRNYVDIMINLDEMDLKCIRKFNIPREYSKLLNFSQIIYDRKEKLIINICGKKGNTSFTISIPQLSLFSYIHNIPDYVELIKKENNDINKVFSNTVRDILFSKYEDDVIDIFRDIPNIEECRYVDSDVLHTFDLEVSLPRIIKFKNQ